MTKKLLNQKQDRWSKFLTPFDYKIVYRPGKSTGKLDAFTRRPGDRPDQGDERLKNMEQMVPKLQNLPERLLLLVDSLPAQGRPSISNLITKAYIAVPLPGNIPEQFEKMKR